MAPESSCNTGSITFDFHTTDHVNPPYSHVCVLGCVGMLVYCIARSLLFRAKSLRLARQFDAAVDPEAPLAVGNRFVCGRVEYAEGQSNAITVRVEQKGTETEKKNRWTHSWTESNRTTNALPFYVRRPNGERVRVEPGAKPLLVDKPDQIKLKERTRRTRIATLTPGEDVIVRGVLAKGHDPEYQHAADYRGSGQGWVMAPRPGKRMEVSTEERGERHRKRAHAFRKTIGYLLVILGLVSLFFLFYPIRLFGGIDTCAEVLDKNTSVSTDSKGHKINHYNVQLHVDASDKPTFTRELYASDWKQVTTGNLLAFRYVPSWTSASEVGKGVSTQVVAIIFGIFATLIGLGVYSGTRDYRRWYEGKLNDTGPGKLPDDPPGN